MDRKIEKKGIALKKLIPVILGCIFIFTLVFLIISRSGTNRYKVDNPSRMTIAPVKYGEFQEYDPVDGTVIPVTSVYLDAEQGGRVEEIYVEGGRPIKKGDLILRFSNTAWQTSLIQTENGLFENMDRQQNTRLSLAQGKLNRKETLMRMEFELLQYERKRKRYDVLNKEKIVISDEEYETLMDQIKYKKDQIALQKERIKQEDHMSEVQLAQADKTIERLQIGLELISKQIDSLVLRAPISGHLSSISAEIGQKINPGQRIGQIDILDKLKIRAGVDQFYNSKVSVGVKGKFTLDGEKYEVEVIKIYPEVINDRFTVDLAFIGDPPEDVKRGQTLTVMLSFSEAARSLMVKKGGFYQQTGGRWVYLISKDGKTARKAPITLGRDNPRHVEVLKGLEEGDWIITSGYDTFNEADELIFGEALELKE